ncbi:uncharacterized protein LOC121868406 [Homarus americanus]|uniref:uncharacterized protein LOC121868406 n=1 Tax=Homarus americanus TaxID=6706 RepID=UPI001C466A8A|nr:uncharacterized protein LOC121868406 [Homarus americanus]
MMLNLLITSAVPFGSRTMNESDCFFSGEYMTAEDIRWENFHHRNGLPLPDVIISNTPPSPLRRTRSYHFLFPEKPSRVQITPTLPPPSLDTPPATPADTLEVGRGSHTRRLHGKAGDGGGGGRHPDRVRSHTRGETQATTPPPSWSSSQPSPALLVLPSAFVSSEGRGWENSSQERGKKPGREGECPGEGEEVSRKIGKDLRKIADEFQVNNARVSTM